MPIRAFLKPALLVAILAAIYLAAHFFIPLTSILDFAGRDFFTRLKADHTAPPPAIDDLVIVELDDETIRVSGQRYPFPRWFHAQALEGFTSINPRAIAYDFVFGGVGYTPEEDEAFRKAVEGSKALVLASYVGSDFREQGPGENFLPEGVAKGPINKFTDKSGIARRGVPFFVNNKTGVREWSWEFRVLFQGGVTTPEEVFFHSNVVGKRPKEKRGFEIPLSRLNLYDINFLVRNHKFHKVPFWRFVTGDLEKEDYEGKILLIGHTSKLSHDKHPTPFGNIYGLYINAEVLLTLLSGRFLYQVPVWVEWIVLLVTLIGLVWFGLEGRIIGMMLWTLGAVLFFIASSAVALWKDLFFEMYWEAIYLALVWLGLTVYRLVAMTIENVSLREEAIHDPLTGFYTRRFLSVRLRHDLTKLGLSARAGKRAGTPGQFSFAMVDLDNFKLVNDTFGHAEGDRTLRAVADVIRSSVRREDVICRYGGDEFCIILRGTAKEGAKVLLERIRSAILADERLSYTTKDHVKSIRVTASFGVVSAQWRPDLSEHMLIRMADRALYQAKKAGRNQIAMADSIEFEEESGAKTAKPELLEGS